MRWKDWSWRFEILFSLFL